jgi:hypothetical protein
VRRRPEPQPDGNGGYLHNGAKRKAGPNTSMYDAGWRHFLSILAYKAAGAGKRVAAVTPADTSQNGSECSKRMQKSLCVRTHACPHCGLILDRDTHAARTIRRARAAPSGPPGVGRGDAPRTRRARATAECQILRSRHTFSGADPVRDDASDGTRNTRKNSPGCRSPAATAPRRVDGQQVAERRQ